MHLVFLVSKILFFFNIRKSYQHQTFEQQCKTSSYFYCSKVKTTLVHLKLVLPAFYFYPLCSNVSGPSWSFIVISWFKLSTVVWLNDGAFEVESVCILSFSVCSVSQSICLCLCGAGVSSGVWRWIGLRLCVCEVRSAGVCGSGWDDLHLRYTGRSDAGRGSETQRWWYHCYCSRCGAHEVHL